MAATAALSSVMTIVLLARSGVSPTVGIVLIVAAIGGPAASLMIVRHALRAKEPERPAAPPADGEP
jgi:hypothetical protein